MNLPETAIQGIFRNEFNWSGNVGVNNINDGSMSSNCEVILGSQVYIFKLYPLERQGIAPKEYEVLKKAGAFKAKVPKVICYGRSEGSSYIIYEKIPGENLKFEDLSDEDKNILSLQIADNILLISKTPFEQFGSLTEIESSYNTWDDFLKANIISGVKNLENSFLKSDLPLKSIEKFMLSFLNIRREIYYGLVWSDFCRENIIVLNNQLSGFIDFEGSFYGDPLLCLGYLFCREGDSGFYNSVRRQMSSFIDIKDSDICFYALLRLMRISRYISVPLPNGQQRLPVGIYFKGLQYAFEFVKNHINVKI